MKNLLIIILTLFSTITNAQVVKGKVSDFYSHEPIIDATIKIILLDNSELHSKTNLNGTFEYKTIQKTLMLITTSFSYKTDTINFKQFEENNNEIWLAESKGIICTVPIIYKAEESNPEYDYKINGQSTTNFVDSLNRKQGRWVIAQNDKYDKKSKYSFGQPMSIGYYKNNVQVGKWLILTPSGKIKKTINYK